MIEFLMTKGTNGVSLETILILITALLGFVQWYLSRKKIEQVHVLVNSQMNAALSQIEDLKAANEKQEAELTRLRTDGIERADKAAVALLEANKLAAQVLLAANVAAGAQWKSEAEALRAEINRLGHEGVIAPASEEETL